MSDTFGKAQLCEHGIDSDTSPCEICRLEKTTNSKLPLTISQCWHLIGENQRLRDRETQLQKAVKREENKVADQRSRRIRAEAQAGENLASASRWRNEAEKLEKFVYNVEIDSPALFDGKMYGDLSDVYEACFKEQAK